MSIPLGDGGEKKFNWASELSTIFRMKSIVVFGGGLFIWNHRGASYNVKIANRNTSKTDLHSH